MHGLGLSSSHFKPLPIRLKLSSVEEPGVCRVWSAHTRHTKFFEAKGLRSRNPAPCPKYFCSRAASLYWLRYTGPWGNVLNHKPLKAETRKSPSLKSIPVNAAVTHEQTSRTVSALDDLDKMSCRGLEATWPTAALGIWGLGLARLELGVSGS